MTAEPVKNGSSNVIRFMTAAPALLYVPAEPVKGK